jgi:hypothetical protein
LRLENNGSLYQTQMHRVKWDVPEPEAWAITVQGPGLTII